MSLCQFHGLRPCAVTHKSLSTLLKPFHEAFSLVPSYHKAELRPAFRTRRIKGIQAEQQYTDQGVGELAHVNGASLAFP